MQSYSCPYVKNAPKCSLTTACATCKYWKSQQNISKIPVQLMDVLKNKYRGSK